VTTQPVVVVGDTFVDLVSSVPSVPLAGEAVWGSQLRGTGGGSGANMAISLADFGVPTSFVTVVGDDDYGRGAIEEYRAAGIDTTGCAVRDEVVTSLCVILLTEHERTILAFADGAASDLLLPQDVAHILDSPPAHLLLSGLAMGATPTGATCADLVSALPDTTAVYFDPNLRVTAASLAPEAVSWYRTAVAHADVLLAGEHELEGLGLERPEGGTLITKYGARGSRMTAEGLDVFVPALRAPVVNATGAGDAYAAAFVAARARGADLVTAARLATAAGSLAVQTPGSRGGISWDAVTVAASNVEVQDD